ncbi:MAG: discoidin domain-containing protein [Chloroflexota bacterium]
MNLTGHPSRPASPTAATFRSAVTRKMLMGTGAAVAAAALLALSVATRTSATGVEVIDFADVQASPIEIEFDATGTTGAFSVDSDIDLACAIVYGQDGSFGQIATDQDMAGGAHEQHRPLLTGLVPDTEYSYRLQGSDANGNLYQSETFTFRTPVAATGGAPNLALGATIVEVSSQFSDAFGGSKAIDGDPSTEWSSAGDGDDAFITLDLGSPQLVDSVAFRTRQMSDGSAITDTFMVTIDGVELGPFAVSDDPVAIGVNGQIVRFDVMSTTGGNTGAVEVEVFGPAASD